MPSGVELRRPGAFNNVLEQVRTWHMARLDGQDLEVKSSRLGLALSLIESNRYEG